MTSDQSLPTLSETQQLLASLQRKMKKAFIGFMKKYAVPLTVEAQYREVQGLMTGIGNETLVAEGRLRIKDAVMSILEYLDQPEFQPEKEQDEYHTFATTLIETLECGAEYGFTIEGYQLGRSQNKWQQRG